MMHDLCRQKGVELIEGHACPDHDHMCLNIPPKYNVSSIVGFLKGKSAIRLNKEFSKAKKKLEQEIEKDLDNANAWTDRQV